MKRLVWRSFGVTLAVEAAPALLRRARALLPPGRAAGAGARPARRYRLQRTAGAFRLWRDGRVIRRAVTLASALEVLASDAQLFVACQAEGLLFVHAGVVALAGRALLLPGRSHAGKTTLTAALVASGAVYYSDEYAVLDARGRVHAFPRPLAHRRGAARRRIAPARARRPPIPVAQIVVTWYREGARAPLRPLSTGRCVLALFKHTVAARARADRALAVLAGVAQRARARIGPRGQAARFARELVEELG